MTPCTFGSSSTSQPGLGYVVISRPQTATFRVLGRHFCLSNLDLLETPERSLEHQICVWLGPDLNETSVYLIWPGRGIYSIGPPLSASNPSRMINLGTGNGAVMNCEPPNNVALELLHINPTPCFLFIQQWGEEYTTIQDEAKSLSFTSYAHIAITDFLSYLEKQKQVPGDAIQSSALEAWYNQTVDALSREAQEKFLFDPTLLLAGIIQNLGTRIKVINNFDIATEELIFIPMVFIRNWGKYLMEELISDSGKELCVKNLLESSTS
ncbi:hypothetical protein GALMADRAFT_141035 [Galerina marginata CBS 339.88]|uniref:Uncharacterized protein n=1 Tax=Galerina marginata (strain CBS 339.88) TaxID=685588 RepID=A0A067SUR0_GALM3|nr:hypothetical protein GALMADRAFT_141035 [Galerina marginata CBS 339.88]